MKKSIFTNSNSRSADNLTELVFLLDRSGSMGRAGGRHHRRLQLDDSKAKAGARQSAGQHRAV